MLNVTVDVDGIAVVRLTGELAFDEAEGLLGKLESAGTDAGWRLAVDLSAVTYIGSAGLSALMNLVARSRLANGRVILFAPSPFVAEVFSITRLNSWFEVCDDLAEARRRLT